MRVIKGLNSRYTLLDLITGKEKDYHVSDMKPFVFDSSALVDPLDIARRDQMEFFIEKISDHRGKLSQQKLLQFFISWMGYDQSYDSWGQFANLRDSVVWEGCVALHYSVHFFTTFLFYATIVIEGEGIGARSVRFPHRLCVCPTRSRK